ncbi:2,3,4,5-tetrahydropyridine-2,6-dicarboxylate N-acetyltransferase [Novipirellula galeiformis]|uniref:2,3,4,5-tetrahydropyridine-2,6-dicarboxylate N-acetyltransferase n=1 Tax=Novipirellula galeiformis TaxID=2528004 RepID=A0A5C6CRI2_9BACT|nr:WcaF family extracellular polysaccharide biosynthesis acetyltransferase [Novipirellula galeiformis]TWU27160.1 2,3,4,5-tetrahydropyridine-2,6-dicarboxylate N-acetyltransferase [Novipirellula galeiformis]
MTLRISENRNAKNYSWQVQGARIAWALGELIFRLIPRPLFETRCWILRFFGAKIGRRVHLYNTVKITFPWQLEIGDDTAIGERARIYNLGKITLGRRVTVSQGCHLCAGSHDYQSPTMDLQKTPITIGDDVWICADAFLGPNVNVGNGAIVGARAVAMKDVPAWTVVAGNPATHIKERTLRVDSE